MANSSNVSGIDHDSWQVTILPLPRGHSRGAVYGFCGGQAVGHAEKLRSGSYGCWWPGGKAELVVLEGKKYVSCAAAGADTIPGLWHDEENVKQATVWVLHGGKLQSRVLHTTEFEQTWATACGTGVVIGMGKQRREPGQYSPNVGLVWQAGHEPSALKAESDVSLLATDGRQFGGSIRGRATLWPSIEAAPVDLTPAKLQLAEVRALDGDLQAGAAFKGFRSRAALWHGSAESFIDLTPKGFEIAGVSAASAGYQAGFVRRKENTRNGTPGSDNRAVMWQGGADRWFDLQTLLPEKKYNASRAMGIHVEGDVLQVGGEASRYELTHEGSPHEGHAVPVAHPVLWTARLRS